MENWDEIRTAFQVARLGTVSGAADVLGVHHATVIRQIDALGDQNLHDLIGATEHHSWQFRNFARRLLDELIRQRPDRGYWESMAFGFPEASFPYFYGKIGAL